MMNTLDATNNLIHIYADGGVIGHNPSSVGGTWAFCYTENDKRTYENSGVLVATTQSGPITNNLTELYAILNSFTLLPSNAHVHLYSDSMVSLGRVFQGWKWGNVPTYLHKLYQTQRTRLIHFDTFQWTLLDGHPTRAHLATGCGKRGHPVSPHNVWCDETCTQAGKTYLLHHTEIPMRSTP